MSEQKIIEELDTSPHNISTITEPFGLQESDPKYRGEKPARRPFRASFFNRKSIKVLTFSRDKRIVEGSSKRKDDKPMKTAKTKISQHMGYMQHGAILLLALASVSGITELLGGGIRAAVITSILVVTLYLHAIDFKK